MKQFEQADLQQVVEDLMKQQSEVTTLEIKSELRKQGFWVRQHDVSDMMDQTHDIMGLTYRDNGHYRIYSAASNTVATASSAPSSQSATMWETRFAGKLGPMCPVELYDGSMTRSAARYAFAKAHGVSYNDVRARRVTA